MNLERARGLVRDAAGPELVERLEHLDRVRLGSSPRDARLEVARGDFRRDFDVVFAGGGLSLVIAARLAGLGIRVAVFDRARVGEGHREWNASGPELATLVEEGLLAPPELDRLVLARYEYGTCRFHGGAGEYPVYGVLDHAVDAGGLLSIVRARAIERGASLFDGHTLQGFGEGRGGVLAQFAGPAGERVLVTTSILVDARGASSPNSGGDMVCPTVGGVIRGLKEGEGPRAVNPAVGEILATIDDASQGPQHVWELFPGRRGEATVYLFTYSKRGQHDSLLSLYARFFETLPLYKDGRAVLVRPTFGYIPGWSRLSRGPVGPGARVALTGDVANRHSPLTLCGFGAMLRSFGPAARVLARAVDDPRALTPTRGVLADDRSLHAVTGALALVLANAAGRKEFANDLLDTAFSTLHAMGQEAYARLLRDEMSPREVTTFLRRTSERRPRVYADVPRLLGPRATLRWGANVAKGRMGRA